MIQNKVIQKALQDYIETEQETSQQLLGQLALMVTREQYASNDLYILARILPDDQLLNLISYYDGEMMRIPTKQEYRDSMLLILGYFLREVKGWTWERVKEHLSYTDASMVVLSRRINELKGTLQKRMEEMMESLELHDEQELINYLTKVFPETQAANVTDDDIKAELSKRSVRKKRSAGFFDGVPLPPRKIKPPSKTKRRKRKKTK